MSPFARAKVFPVSEQTVLCFGFILLAGDLWLKRRLVEGLWLWQLQFIGFTGVVEGAAKRVNHARAAWEHVPELRCRIDKAGIRAKNLGCSTLQIRKSIGGFRWTRQRSNQDMTTEPVAAMDERS